MSKNIEDKKKLTSSWFQDLQNQMISSFESLDTKKFQKKTWDRPGDGGGTMAIMKGEVFEKVGVNISVVHGKFSDEFRKKIPGTENSANFWAAGISIVAHMKNPKIAKDTVFLEPLYKNKWDNEDTHEKLKQADILGLTCYVWNQNANDANIVGFSRAFDWGKDRFV